MVIISRGLRGLTRTWLLLVISPHDYGPPGPASLPPHHHVVPLRGPGAHPPIGGASPLHHGPLGPGVHVGHGGGDGGGGGGSHALLHAGHAGGEALPPIGPPTVGEVHPHVGVHHLLLHLLLLLHECCGVPVLWWGGPGDHLPPLVHHHLVVAHHHLGGVAGGLGLGVLGVAGGHLVVAEVHFLGHFAAIHWRHHLQNTRYIIFILYLYGIYIVFILY